MEQPKSGVQDWSEKTQHQSHNQNKDFGNVNKSKQDTHIVDHRLYPGSLIQIRDQVKSFRHHTTNLSPGTYISSFRLGLHIYLVRELINRYGGVGESRSYDVNNPTRYLIIQLSVYTKEEKRGG